MSGRSSWRSAVTISLAVTLGSAAGTAWAAFSSTTSNGPNSFSAVAPDTTAPTISRAVAAKTTDTTPGTIRQGGNYYVYGQVTDDVSVATVTANTSSFDTGVTAASMSSTGGPWTVGGQTYNYRSAVLTANTPLTTGSSYSYSITATDGSGNSTSPSYSVTIETYNSVISSTSGLVSYWRMGDSGTGSSTTVLSDTFTDFTGWQLENHNGGTGASWTRHSASDSDAVITGGDRVRRNGAGASLYYASGVPASADYAVQADVYVASTASDGAAVIGRASTTANTYYRAGYFRPSPGPRWELYKVVDGTSTMLGNYPENLTAGTTHTVTLEMMGSSIRLLVNGEERIAVTDSSITAAGRAGLRMGYLGAGSAPTDSTGLHLDNFSAKVPTWVADSASTNHGTYFSGVTLGAGGALVGDSNNAAQFDGTNDYALVPDAASLDLGDGPFTLEAWVKRSNSSTAEMNIFQKGASAPQFHFWNNEVWVAKDNTASFVKSSTTVTDTTWHHLVVTKSGTSRNLYIDGVDRTSLLTDQTLVNTTSALYLGAKNGTAGFLAGAMDELAVYNTALSAATVLDHYNAGKGTG